MVVHEEEGNDPFGKSYQNCVCAAIYHLWREQNC